MTPSRHGSSAVLPGGIRALRLHPVETGYHGKRGAPAILVPDLYLTNGVYAIQG